MLSILSTLVPVFGIILLGIVVERKRFLPVTMSVCLNQFVYWIGLPSLLFSQLARMEAGQISSGLIWGMVVSALFCYTLAHGICSSGFRQHKPESTVFALLSSFPNSAFMGLPIVVLLLPNDPLAMVVGSLGASLYTGVLIFADNKLEFRQHSGGGRLRSVLHLIRSLSRNPLLLASASGIVFSVAKIPLPMPLQAMISMLGATASPCALFCIGMILSVQMTSSRGFVKGWVRRQLPIHFVKLVLQPLAAWGCLHLFGVSGVSLAVGILISAMPTGVAAYIIAERYQVSMSDSSLGIVIDTGLSALTLPLWILVMQAVGMF